MRTLLIPALAGALALFPADSFAQSLFDFGLKGGANLDDFATKYDHTAVLGGHAGLFLRVKPPLVPGFQGEVLVSSLGSDVSIDGVSADVRTLAVQVPVFAVFAIGPAELHGGGYYEHYLSKDLSAELDVPMEGEVVTLDDLNDDGYGLLVGAGLHLGHFYAGVRYNVGIEDLGTGPYLGDVRSRQWQAYIGLGLVNPN